MSLPGINTYIPVLPAGMGFPVGNDWIIPGPTVQIDPAIAAATGGLYRVRETVVTSEGAVTVRLDGDAPTLHPDRGDTWVILDLGR